MRPAPRRPSAPRSPSRDSAAPAERPPATLADLQAAGLALFCWCNRCCHNGVLPLAPLLARLGPQQPVPLVGRYLVCSACGSKDIATRPHWKDLGEGASHAAPPEEAGEEPDGIAVTGTKDDHTLENGVLPARQE